MKSGAGDDPFAEAEEASGGTDGDESVDAARGAGAAEPEPEPPQSGRPGGTDDSGEDDTAGGSGASSPAPGPDRSDIPWVLRRDSVKGERDHVHQFFLRDEAARGERRLRSQVEDELDRDVSKLDLREAAYLVAMDHPEEVADRLREWGYEYL